VYIAIVLEPIELFLAGKIGSIFPHYLGRGKIFAIL